MSQQPSEPPTDRAQSPRDDQAAPRSSDASPCVVTGHLFRVREGNGWRLSSEPPPPEPEPVHRPARVARMLAIAHHLERAIQAGRVADRAALARELGLTRARISQLLALTLLAPDIQEALLFAEAIDGREPISMRALRPLVKLPTWQAQRNVWRVLAADAALLPD